jgi:hypothetical protein
MSSTNTDVDRERLSAGLQVLAAMVDDALCGLVGVAVPWALVLQVDGCVDTVTNCNPVDGLSLVEEMLAVWHAGDDPIPPAN